MATATSVTPDSPTKAPQYRRSTARVSFNEGFWPDEATPTGEPFRWMSTRGRLGFAPEPAARFVELTLICDFDDCSQQIVTDAGDTIVLPSGHIVISFAIAPDASSVVLDVNKHIPLTAHPSDTRALAVCVRSAIVHADPVRHAAVVRQQQNSVLNTREMLAGRTSLDSTPRVLGIDLYGACNVKPPCVYCEWDWNKDLEGTFVDVPFDEHTLASLGPLYDNSANLVNCSIGEPFMMKNIDELLDEFADNGKALDMTSNGQILTDRNIQRLVGRDIDLYVSLDAATAETYARLRNNRFDALVANLKRLVAAKGGRGQWPRLNLVFMPMKANVHELDAFIELTAAIGADRLVLRPLNYSEKNTLDWNRAGYQFTYREELLPFDRLVWLSGRTKAMCDRLGVALADQMDFGGSFGEQFQAQYDAGVQSLTPATPPAPSPAIAAAAPAAPADAVALAETATTPSIEAVPAEPSGHMPVCTEPWKSLYVLRRGVFPCCYGVVPLAPMDGAADAWNSDTMQGIRSALADGRFHKYCLDSLACPIVRKQEHAHALPMVDAWRMRLRHWASRGRAALHGGPSARVRVVYSLQWSRIRLKRIVSEPAYVRLHIGKLVRRVRGRH
jgi:MoaA/NifB/PqqE/SkfB family radical SAM enzyme